MSNSSPGIVVRELVADDWQEWRALRLAALGEAPYAFSSKLSDWQGDGDLEQRWRDRLATVPFNVVADLGGTPAGMVSAVAQGTDVELISMWVSPPARGVGVGDALVEAVLGWAAAGRARRVVLRVMEANDHARAFYRRHGFVDSALFEERSGEPRERWMVRS